MEQPVASIQRGEAGLFELLAYVRDQIIRRHRPQVLRVEPERFRVDGIVLFEIHYGVGAVHAFE